MHQTLHAIKTGFISIIVNNNDKYIFFLDLSVGYLHFKYTLNWLSNLCLVQFAANIRRLGRLLCCA